MSYGELAGDLKTNREESLTKHVGFVYAYAKKAKKEKLMIKKVGATSRKSKNHNRQSKTRHISLLVFQFVSVWLRFSRCFINPYIFKLAKHELPFQIFVSKFEGWKGGTSMVGPGRHLALLRHWHQAWKNDETTAPNSCAFQIRQSSAKRCSLLLCQIHPRVQSCSFKRRPIKLKSAAQLL